MRNMWKYNIEGKNRVCVVLTRLKVNIWHDHLYSSAQSEVI